MSKDIIKPTYLTKEGMKNLKELLYYKTHIKKEKIKDCLSNSWEQGDERENDPFTLAFEAFNVNQKEINTLKKTLNYCKIFETTDTSQVCAGHKILLRNQNGKETILQIVSDLEIDPLKGKISPKSKIGTELLGKSIGYEIIMGKALWKIIKIFE